MTSLSVLLVAQDFTVAVLLCLPSAAHRGIVGLIVVAKEVVYITLLLSAAYIVTTHVAGKRNRITKGKSKLMHIRIVRWWVVNVQIGVLQCPRSWCFVHSFRWISIIYLYSVDAKKWLLRHLPSWVASIPAPSLPKLGWHTLVADDGRVNSELFVMTLITGCLLAAVGSLRSTYALSLSSSLLLFLLLLLFYYYYYYYYYNYYYYYYYYYYYIFFFW